MQLETMSRETADQAVAFMRDEAMHEAEMAGTDPLAVFDYKMNQYARKHGAVPAAPMRFDQRPRDTADPDDPGDRIGAIEKYLDRLMRLFGLSDDDLAKHAG